MIQIIYSSPLHPVSRFHESISEISLGYRIKLLFLFLIYLCLTAHNFFAPNIQLIVIPAKL